ncbi:MAG TPA: glycosyltransferase N-terminal domain-containing protein [Candidatus Polarisedimenticolia bacterium]|jgi:3-deoxy-D-manno-octulosonic-acid transferase|nr:glycosyltransferase N-terminal domain-containing protein [Candidatus Polarisedimenticolia bacterium]
MYRLYAALLVLAWAVVLPCQMLMTFLKRASPTPLRERLGFPPDDAAAGGFWIHAVSVGEVRLALSLLASLRRRFPGVPVHLTTATATGRALAAAGTGGTRPPESIAALPFDLPFAMGRLLDRLRPRAILILETEIWPNLLRLAARRGVPVVLVNGRISPRAYPRYRLVRPLLHRALPGVSLFGMQSREDGDRIVSLGADGRRVRVTGNLKFDLDPPAADRQAVRLRLGLEDGEPLFVAGSTAAGEERPVLHAFALLRRSHPSARLVLAPRHPENFAAAERLAREAGHTVLLWSRLAADGPGAPAAGTARRPPPPRFDVLVLDAMGVLPVIYAASDLVFVGGSLVPRGGHNVLEPAAIGRPVLFGPHMENFRAAAEALTAAGAGFVARDADELGSLLLRLVSDRAGYAVSSTMARRVVETNRGALGRTIALVEEVLAPAPARGLQVARP